MTTPTQAQIEAGEYDLKCTNGHDRCYMGTSDDCPYCERVALTAAAEAHPQPTQAQIEAAAKAMMYAQEVWNTAVAHTIERCAQVADDERIKCEQENDPQGYIQMGQVGAASRIAAAIRALKDKP